MCWPLTEVCTECVRDEQAGEDSDMAHRTRGQINHCVKFCVAGAQSTNGGGRAARAGTETGRKAFCPSYVWGDSRVSCAYFFTFSSTISELKGFFVVLF